MTPASRDRIETAVSALLAAGSAVLAVWLAARACRLWPLYRSAETRNEFSAVMAAYVRDVGWGLSNHDIKAVRCTADACTATLKFRYHASRPQPARDIRLSWKHGSPEDYALE